MSDGRAQAAAKFLECPHLDLSHALTADAQHPADLTQRQRLVFRLEPEAHREHAAVLGLSS